jgi:hypothetical protein
MPEAAKLCTPIVENDVGIFKESSDPDAASAVADPA